MDLAGLSCNSHVLQFSCGVTFAFEPAAFRMRSERDTVSPQAHHSLKVTSGYLKSTNLNKNKSRPRKTN